MNADEIIKKKKVDIAFLKTCIEKYGKDGYYSYNGFQKKDKNKLTKEEYLYLMRCKI